MGILTNGDFKPDLTTTHGHRIGNDQTTAWW